MQFRQTKKFAKQLRRLKKKYKSLDSDIKKLRKVLEKFPTGVKSKNWALLKIFKGITIIKTRLSCAYIKRKSFRIVYAYNQRDRVLEFIDFLEIYSKSEKDREDQNIIEEYLDRL